MKNFDIFVIPFMIGLTFIVGYTVFIYIKWITQLRLVDKGHLRKNFWRTLPKSLKEIVMESLFHRKIFKINPVLGYMHTSLAFGWLMLILVGNIQSHLYSRYIISWPYFPIFYKYFEPYPKPFFSYRVFEILMELLLLFVLSGVFLAYFKRIKSNFLGMRRTTRHSSSDRFAMTALWFIFPLRLLAESFTAHHRGEFLTGTLYKFFSGFLPVYDIAYPLWWAYSLALGVFFIAMPMSRYMHIITEPLLIILRNTGIKTNKYFSTYTDVELNACSRCGICIDACQMAGAANIRDVQAVYFLRSARDKNLTAELANHCLMCGRCNEACPVGIDQVALRLIKRKDFSQQAVTYSYIFPEKVKQSKVLYFAGCMTHLTPTISRSMLSIFKAADENVSFMDADGSICCGRPLMMSGNIDSAFELIRKNRQIIAQSGAELLVTSCPICYKTFVEDYDLDIKVMHHTQYIKELLEQKRIEVKKSEHTTLYHDPCELGRGLGVYNEPREVLGQISTVTTNEYERNNSLCCGGCVGNTQISTEKRELVTADAVKKMTVGNPDFLVTSCPLCKKTFNRFTEKAVDISQLVSESLVKKPVSVKFPIN